MSDSPLECTGTVSRVRGQDGAGQTGDADGTGAMGRAGVRQGGDVNGTHFFFFWDSKTLKHAHARTHKGQTPPPAVLPQRSSSLARLKQRHASVGERHRLQTDADGCARMDAGFS